MSNLVAQLLKIGHKVEGRTTGTWWRQQWATQSDLQSVNQKENHLSSDQWRKKNDP
jgi:hypothetical protein